jgi:hypothetical protein
MAYIEILSGLSEKLKADNSDWTPDSVNAMRTAWAALFALVFADRHERPNEATYKGALVDVMNNKEVLQTFEALTILHLTMCDVFSVWNHIRNISTYKDTYEKIKEEAREIWDSDFKKKVTTGRRQKTVYNHHGQSTLKMGNTIGFISKLDGVSTIPLIDLSGINLFLTKLYDIIKESQIIINALRNSRVAAQKGAWLEQYDAIHEYDEKLGRIYSERTNTAKLDPIIIGNISRERSNSESSTSSTISRHSNVAQINNVSNTEGEESNEENFAFQPITRERRSAESTIPSPNQWQQYAEQRKINQERNTRKVHRSVMNEIVGKQQTRNRHTAVMKELEEKKKKIMNEQKQKKRDQVIQAKAAKNKAVEHLKSKFAENKEARRVAERRVADETARKEAARRVADETARKEAEIREHQVTTLPESDVRYIKLTKDNIDRSSPVGTTEHARIVQQDGENLNSKEYRIRQKQKHLLTILAVIDGEIDGLDKSIREEEELDKDNKQGSSIQHLEKLKQRIAKQVSIKNKMDMKIEHINNMYKRADIDFYSGLNQNIRYNSRITALEKKVTQKFTLIDRNAFIKRVNRQLALLAFEFAKARIGSDGKEITPYFVKIAMTQIPIGLKSGETPDPELLEELRIILNIPEKGVSLQNMNKAHMIRIGQQEGGKQHSMYHKKNRSRCTHKRSKQRRTRRRTLRSN